jgi:hypothetical protein
VRYKENVRLSKESLIEYFENQMQIKRDDIVVEKVVIYDNHRPKHE